MPTRRRTGWGFVFDVSRKSVLEAELVHDFIFRRFQLSWVAVLDCEHITSHYEAHYHEERNHQGKNNVLLFPLPTQAVRGERAKVRCRERLGGLLKYYEREAA